MIVLVLSGSYYICERVCMRVCGLLHTGSQLFHQFTKIHAVQQDGVL